MQYQIDFLPVGDGSCGDAIAIRYGDLISGNPDRQAVVLIDGGYASSSEMIVDFVREHYSAQKIDLVVSTHPDSDHINGLPGVLESIPVDYLWMHQPWEHSSDFLASRQEEFSTASLTKKLQQALQGSNDLALAADAAGVPVFEPFTGRKFTSDYGTLTVLGPTPEYYGQLLAQILDKSAALAQAQPNALAAYENVLQKALLATVGAVEAHHIETLTNRGTTSASNNSSVILLLELADGSGKFLFTGDAGMPALEMAYDQYSARGHGSGQLNLVQVPHHGSRRNVGPSILDKFLGEHTPHPDMPRGEACVSVGKTCTGDGHPKKVATNAFKRRGYPVTQTRGRSVMFGFDRPGWGPVDSLPLFGNVEADE